MVFHSGSAGMLSLQCRPGFDPWVGKSPWRRERLPIPVFWPGEFHGLFKYADKVSLKPRQAFLIILTVYTGCVKVKLLTDNTLDLNLNNTYFFFF